MCNKRETKTKVDYKLTSTSETAERSNDRGIGIAIEGEDVIGELGAVEIVWSSSERVQSGES